MSQEVVSVDNAAPEGTLQTSGLATPVGLPENEEAAMKFTQLLPFIKKLGNALQSQKGVVRVLHALAEFPLGATKPRLLNDAERQLFQIFMEIQGFKATVVNDIMRKNAEEHQAAEALKQAATASSETEVNNGGN